MDRFHRANVDRAIVMTQYDLRGFAHPIGVRFDKPIPKYLDATTGNFVAFAAGLGKSQPDDTRYDRYADYFESDYDDYLRMCKDLARSCDTSQKEAIQLIIHEILRQHRQLIEEVAAEEGKTDPYLKPLSRDNRWGRAVLALAQTFEVAIEEETDDAQDRTATA